MTDLSMLFTTSLLNKTIDPFSIDSKISKKSAEASLPSASRKTEQWDLAELQASLRKGIKKQLPLSSMSQQLESFSARQKQQYIKKALIFGGIILLISYLFNFDRRIFFYFALLVCLKLTPSLPFKIAQEKIIQASSRIINPIVYSALFYYLLKWATNANMNEMNVSLTITSIIFTMLYVVVEYCQPCFTLSTEHLRFKTVMEKDFGNRMVLFASYVYQRIKFYANIKSVLVLSFLMSCMAQFAVLLYFKGQMVNFFKLKNFLYAICLFIFVECLLLLFRYIDFSFEQIKNLRNKMPIFMSLLRIEGSSSYRKAIQDKCLLNILNKMSKNSCFLASQTCKSLVYDTYMQLFNQLASIQLGRTQTIISKQLGVVSANRSVINSSKTLVIDLFIYFRKIKAYISQQHTALQSLQSLSQTILLMRIIALSDEQAYLQKQPIKANPRLVDTMEMIQQKFSKLAGESTLLPFVRGELMFNQRKLAGWICSMRKGWL